MNYRLTDNDNDGTPNRDSLAEKYNSGVSYIQYDFTYDKRGQLTSSKRSDTSDYDVNNYLYDNAGNVTKFDFSNDNDEPDVTYGDYNEANQSTFNRLSYDVDGNLSGDASWTYTYDANNRLIAMDGKSGNNLDLGFYYDYMGRRVQKKVYTNGSLTKDVKFLYQGMTLIAELDSSETVDYSFHWGPDKSDVLGGAEGMVYMRDWDNNQNLYPSYDMNGNLVGLLDGGGNFAAWYEYDSNGRVVESGGTYDDVLSDRLLDSVHGS